MYPIQPIWSLRHFSENYTLPIKDVLGHNPKQKLGPVKLKIIGDQTLSQIATKELPIGDVQKLIEEQVPLYVNPISEHQHQLDDEILRKNCQQHKFEG